MPLSDCDPGGAFVTVDNSYLVPSAVLTGATITQGNIKIPALVVTWGTITSPYIAWVDIEFQDSGATVPAKTVSAKPGDGGIPITEGITAGKTYNVRYRARGIGDLAVGPWSASASVVIPTLMVSGSAVNVNGGANINSIGGGARAAYQPETLQLTDGDTWTTSTNTGVNPIVSIETNPALLQAGLSPGESLNLYIDSLTPTSFTFHARKHTATSPTSRTAGPGASAGSGPQFQMDKGVADDSYNGYYTFTAGLVLVAEYIYTDDPTPKSPGSGDETDVYFGEGTLQGFVKDSGGTWHACDTVVVDTSTGYAGPVTWSVYYSGVVGDGAGDEFGVSLISAPSGSYISSFDEVDWTSTTVSGDATATPGGEKVTVTVTLRNP